MLRRSLLLTHAGILVLLLALFSVTPAHAANCEGLPITGGFLPAGDYILLDNCVLTSTLNVQPGPVTINGNGFVIDANNAPHEVLIVGPGEELSLRNVTIRRGTVGLTNNGTLTINNSIISENSFGGIYSDGILTIINSTVSENNAGIRNHSNFGVGTALIINSTISKNTLDGIFNYAGAVTITSSTISENGNTGIYNFSGTTTVSNTILSGNYFNCLFGTVIDGGGNLVNTANGGSCIRINPLIDADPMLGAFNGSYYSLLAGSPAIDAAPDCAGLTTDQIGTARPQLGACDIGAIEALINPLTGEVILPPATVPGTPPLNTWNATAPESRAEAYGVGDNVYATIHMQNGAWQYNSGGIPQELIDYGVIMAIDVWEQGGDQVFDHYEKVCLLGEGRLIYFDATQSPRPMVEITPVTFEDGYTCGWIPNAGTLVLIDPE